MRAVLFAVLLTLAAPAFADDKADAAATVTHLFTSPDFAAAAKTDCAPDAVVIDDFAPHAWHGATACVDWAHDYAAMAKREGIVPGKLTLGKMHRVDVTGDRAYVVVPADFTFTQKGKTVATTGNTVTAALHKTKAGWLITGWSWAKN